jgi:hypothetical protein
MVVVPVLPLSAACHGAAGVRPDGRVHAALGGIPGAPPGARSTVTAA